jgi:membrane fusion protein (multidrug efflux system)
MVATVSVEVQRKENVITVPPDALIQRAAGWFVYLVHMGKAKFTPVEIGVSNGRSVEVRKNISVGDTLVVRGQFKLSDEAKVKIHGVAAQAEGDMAEDRQ